MSTPHKATPDEWKKLRRWAEEQSSPLHYRVLLEVADRVAALEEDDHKQRLVALHHEQRLAVLEAAATQPPAPAADHFRGATEMVATDEDLRKYWNKMRNSGSMFDDALRAVYNLGRQHGAQSRQEREMVPVLRVLVKPGPGCDASVSAWISSVEDLPIGEHILYAFPGASQPRQEVEPTPPPAPAGGLLYEVARLLANRISLMRPSADCTPLARDVLVVAADWLQQRSNTIANGSQWAEMLREEADR